MILSRPFYNPSTSYLMGLLTLKGQDTLHPFLFRKNWKITSNIYCKKSTFWFYYLIYELFLTPFQTKCCNSTLATKSLSFSSTAESWLMNFQLQLPIRILVDRKMKCFTRYLSLGNWVLAKPPLSSDTFINILANIIEQLLVLTLLSKWLIGMLIRLLDYKCGTLLAKYVFKCDFCVILSVQTSFGWKYSYRKSQIRKIKI